MAEEIKIDLDPKKVLDAVKDMETGFKELAAKLEAALGKEAPKSIGKLEDAAEKGTNKISTFFRNLGNRVKEDLKTAFAATEVLAGAKFAKDLGEGVKQVFEMEKAFDRLNTRLSLTTKQTTEFKKAIGQKVAGTGQKLEDILPGVETVAAKGGVKSPEQLSQIGEALGKLKATTGEGVEGVADTIVEILKNQGQKISADSFKKTLDTLQSTRTTGAFKTAGEAGQAIENLAPYAKKLGLSTRELGGLAATASKSGASGQDILKQIMEKGTTIGGQQQLNAVLGQEIFKNGKLDATALGKVNTKRFGDQKILEEASGLTGASGADLSRFVESFKTGMGDFNKVINGVNETSGQFETATDNLASKVEEFKEKSKESGREVGEALSILGKDLLKGNFKKSASDTKEALKAAWENKGTIGADLGITAGAGLVMGGGLNHLLKKLGGKVGGGVGGFLGEKAGELAGEKVAEAEGVQKVYVVNASEIGGAGSAAEAAGEAGGGALKKMAGKLAPMLATVLPVAGAAVVGAVAGAAAVKGLDKITGGGYSNVVGSGGGALADKLHASAASDAEAAQMEKSRQSFNARNQANLSPEEFAKAVETGTLRAHTKAQKPSYTNPSAVTARGGSK